MTEIKLNGAMQARFPWRVSYCQRDRHPTIVSADGQVVCYMMNGSYEIAERIVRNCNEVAEKCGIESV